MITSWGWRSIFVYVYVMVLITACGTENDLPPQPPTEPPPITLTVRIRNSIPPPTATPTPQITTSLFSSRRTPAHYTAARSDTLESISHDFGIDAPFLQTANPQLDFTLLAAGTHVLIPGQISPTPIRLEIRPPLCTLTVTDQLLCIGEVYNPLALAVEDVGLKFSLLTSGTGEYFTGITEVESRTIAPYDASPYRIQFDTREPYQRLLISPLGAVISAHPENPAVDKVQVQDERVTITQDQYQVQLTLSNQGEEAVQDLRAIISVYDDTQLVGFRTYDLKDMAPLEVVSLTTDIGLLKSGTSLSHSVSISSNAIHKK